MVCGVRRCEAGKRCRRVQWVYIILFVESRVGCHTCVAEVDAGVKFYMKSECLSEQESGLW